MGYFKSVPRELEEAARIAHRRLREEL